VTALSRHPLVPTHQKRPSIVSKETRGAYLARYPLVPTHQKQHSCTRHWLYEKILRLNTSAPKVEAQVLPELKRKLSAHQAGHVGRMHRQREGRGRGKHNNEAKARTCQRAADRSMALAPPVPRALATEKPLRSATACFRRTAVRERYSSGEHAHNRSRSKMFTRKPTTSSPPRAEQNM
jgi:hypothetical protein